jgi:hypothetical protein
MKRVSLALILFVFSVARAQTTYKDVAPIFYSACTKCHNPIGVGPMSLMNYTETYVYKNLISSYVSAGLMPPWPPDTTYHRFFNERILTVYQKNQIINWIDSGAAKGDTTLAPIAPTYVNKYKLHGTPDLIIKMPAFASNATTADAYNCFVLPSGLTQDRIIRAYEVVPGNSAIVHHATIAMDTMGVLTNNTSGACYVMPDSVVPIGVYAPGAAPVIYPGKAPLKMGFRLKANCKILLQLHYPAGSAGKIDSTEVRFFFYPLNTKGIREVQNVVLKKTEFNIPSDTIETLTVSGTVPRAISLYSLFPHQHKVGVSLYDCAYNGIDTIPLIRINKWNFRWQGYYTYPKLVKIPAGYTIRALHKYNNTANNPNNPFSPPQVIHGGYNTYNEMLTNTYQYVSYQPGDDTINITNLLAGDTLLSVANIDMPAMSTKAFPNPFDKLVHIGYTINTPSEQVSVVVYNIYGNKVKEFVRQKVYAEGYYETTWDGRDDNGNQLPIGVYIYTISANKVSCSGKLVIAR